MTYAIQDQRTGHITKGTIEDAARIARLDEADIEWAIEEHDECTTDTHRITEWDDAGLPADTDAIPQRMAWDTARAVGAAARIGAPERAGDVYGDDMCSGGADWPTIDCADEIRLDWLDDRVQATTMDGECHDYMHPYDVDGIVEWAQGLMDAAYCAGRDIDPTDDPSAAQVWTIAQHDDGLVNGHATWIGTKNSATEAKRAVADFAAKISRMTPTWGGFGVWEQGDGKQGTIFSDCGTWELTRHA